MKEKEFCKLFFKTLSTCLSEDKCIPEIVNQSNGKMYLRSPKAKKDTTKYLKDRVSRLLCK